MKRKLIAILCVFSMLVGMFYVPTAASETQASEAEASETSEETKFEELTLGHFGAIDRPNEGTSEAVYMPYKPSNQPQESLDNVAVTGIYNFKLNESCLFIGGDGTGLRIRSEYRGDTLEISYFDGSKGNQPKIIDASALNGNSPVDRNVKIRTTFSFANFSEDRKTADITIGVQVDDIAVYSETIKEGPTQHFCKVLRVDETLKYASYDENAYDIVPLSDFSQHNKGYTARTETDIKVWGDNSKITSLKNKAIEGYYTFPTGTGTETETAVSFGGDTSTDIRITTMGYNENNLYIYCNGNQTLLKPLTPGDLELTTLRNTELHIRVTFAYINETETTTDVQVGIDIAHKGTFYFVLKNCTKTNLSQRIYIYATTERPLTHRSSINKDYTISDLSSGGADKAVAERISDARDEIVHLEKLKGEYKIGRVIDTATVEGYYNFESTGADSTSAVYYGSRKAGICLSPNANHDLEVSYVNGEGKRTDVGVIRAEVAGFALTNRYIKIKTILSVQASVNDKRTVVVGIIVEDPSVPSENRIPYRKAFKLQNVSNSHLDTVMSLWAKQKVTVSDHILAPTHLVDITLSDFGINYNPASSVGGTLVDKTDNSKNKISFDGKLFSADVQFGTGSGWIRLAGKQAWEGIGFGSWGNGASFQFRRDNATNNPAYTLTNVPLDMSKTGLSKVTDSFNLKISIEFVDLESDGAKNDVRYGLYFNDKLYDDQFFYSYNDKDAFGDYLHLTAGLDQCESVTRSANNNIAPYILEDFGVEAKEYKTTDDKKSYKASIQMADTEKNSISGKIALTTYGQLCLYNNNNADNYSCFYFSAKYGGVVQLLGGNNHPQTKGFETGDLGVDPDEAFTFTLTKETLDADSDGLKDDVRLGVWINNQLHKNKYFYFTDLAENMNGCVEMLYSNGDITVNDSIETSYINLSQADSYQVTGYGNLTVNGVTATHGQIIGSVGDYTIRCTDYDAYIKKVSVFKPGDAHLDGEFTVQDLVAMKKAESNVVLSTKAAQKSADYDLNDSVNDDDLDALRRLLLGEEVDVVAVASYTFEDNVMPIMGGTAPYRTVVTREDGNTYTFDLINDNSYRLLKEAGINLITSGSGDFFSRANDKMCLTA